MPHVKGHIIKIANQSSSLKKYQNSGGFFHYIFNVSDFENQEMRFLLTDSFEPGQFFNMIVILSKENYDDTDLIQGQLLDLVLLPQSVFSYASSWSLDDRNNWMVYDPAKHIDH